MGGLLVDTLAYNFLKSTNEYDSKSYPYYDFMSRDFFKYLSGLSDQDYYAAPGSGQRVGVKKKFQAKAKKAHKRCLEAIAAEKTKGVNTKWKTIYGRPFPAATEDVKEATTANASLTWTDTEQFIEDQFSIDIRKSLTINCEVKQQGFQKHFLRFMLQKRMPLLPNKKLRFWITDISVKPPYEIYWKVLNRGEVAQRRDCVRGQIHTDKGNGERSESTTFRGDHVVECYAIKDGIVIAKDRIDVPITTTERSYA